MNNSTGKTFIDLNNLIIKTITYSLLHKVIQPANCLLIHDLNLMNLHISSKWLFDKLPYAVRFMSDWRFFDFLKKLKFWCAFHIDVKLVFSFLLVCLIFVGMWFYTVWCESFVMIVSYPYMNENRCFQKFTDTILHIPTVPIKLTQFGVNNKHTNKKWMWRKKFNILWFTKRIFFVHLV